MAKYIRGATNLCGVIAIDKPIGMTSHDVIARMRRITGEGRIGHTGTLDPAASGLLLVCIGKATKLADLLMAAQKTYEAKIVFGASTDTDDAQGEVIARSQPPVDLGDRDFVCKRLKAFLGPQMQTPPQYSAIKKNGKKAYELARTGKPVVLEPRQINIYSIELIDHGSDWITINTEVSKGTYIRSLARDVGQAFLSQAHLGSLRRLASGVIDISQSYTLDEIATTPIDELPSLFLDLGPLANEQNLLNSRILNDDA